MVVTPGKQSSPNAAYVQCAQKRVPDIWKDRNVSAIRAAKNREEMQRRAAEGWACGRGTVRAEQRV